MATPKTIVFIGAGNVATQLSLSLKKSGYKILQVYSRTKKSASALAKKLHCPSTTSFKSLMPDADIYFIAVKDDAISQVIEKLPQLGNSLVIHTSGATDISVLTKKFQNCGVIWQAQTIQLITKVDFKNVPLIIEANNPSTEKKLKQLAKSLSNTVYHFTSLQRRVLHLGAVWVNNFPNHLYFLSKKFLEKHHLPYSLFSSLIMSTAIGGIRSPYDSQTGPARRHDKKTMKRHLELLKNDKNARRIYRLLSESIEREYSP